MNGLEQVKCARCGYVFANAAEAMAHSPRVLCPECGATGRHASVSIQDELRVTSSLYAIGFAKSKSKWFAKVWSKTELFKLLGRYHKVERSLNKRTDEYHEVIHDAKSGELIREVHEPLSEHQGHGSAKKRD